MRLVTRPLVLDTDLGTDVDDLLALVLLARAPEVSLAGVTTVYGDTVLRARLARRVCDLLGVDVPVAVGRGEPLSGRAVWWPGHEGRGVAGLDRVDVEGAPDAVGFLLGAGEIEVCAVGPLTNLAAALRADPGWARRVRHLYVMGGDFTGGRAEHNVSSDTVAAREVFASGIPITVAGLDVTTRLPYGPAELDRISAPGGELADLIIDQTRRWWDFLGRDSNPHDPLAALTALTPELFSFTDRAVGVGDDGVLSADGPSVRVVADLDEGRVAEELWTRLEGA